MEIKYENKIVTFLDILGFKKLIADSENSEIAQSTVNKLALIFNRIDEIISDYSDTFHCARFSDSIIIIQTSPPKYEVDYFKFIVAIHHFLIREGLLLRGAIVKGDIYYNHSGKYFDMFGPAMVKAYQIEQQAVYPRVIVDESVATGVTIHTFPHGTAFSLGEYLDKFGLIKDIDGFYFVDYLFPLRKINDKTIRVDMINNLEGLIRHGLNNKDMTIAKKYAWLKTYWIRAQSIHLVMDIS